MTSRFKVITALLALVFGGCTGPRPPPGWPSGEERPINPSQVSKAVK
ncbi:hypothetical protein [Variovorax sp. dw_954]|nr:hypothetical protein [Variovorax sp. dw_954]